jgi:hypothetical protein
MEQVVMGQCQSGLAVETCCIEPTACLERFGEPPHHGYTGLFVGGNGLRQPVQEESFFTQGLAMIRDIYHRGIETLLLRLEIGDSLAQHMVGIENGIVIGIDDALAITAPQLAGVAGGLEAAKGGGIPFVVRRGSVRNSVCEAFF